MMMIETHNRYRGRGSAARASMGALLALALGACSLAPVREQRTEAPALPAGFSETGDAVQASRWWESFGDPQLDALIERALQDNFSLRAVWDRLDQAAAVARKAGADLYPSLDATASAGRERQQRNGSSSTSNSFTAGLSAAYEVDLWGRVRSSAEAAELDRQATGAQLQTAALSLSAQVADTWYQLAEQAAQEALLQQQLDTNLKVLELITVRFRHGESGAIDVLQQRQLAESVRGDLALAQSRLGVLQHQLAVLLGGTVDSVPMPALSQARLVEPPALPATGVPLQQLQQRPDVREQWLSLLAADQRVAVAVADRYPRLSLTAGITGSSDRARDLFDDWLANLSANLLLPVIDGGQRRAEVERTRAAAAEALNNYREALVQGFSEVEDALLQERKQRAYLDSLDVQLQLSRQAIERLRDSYRNGAVDYLRVLDALLTDQSLARTRLLARRQLLEYRIALHQALAGGWALQRPSAPQQEDS